MKFALGILKIVARLDGHLLTLRTAVGGEHDFDFSDVDCEGLLAFAHVSVDYAIETGRFRSDFDVKSIEI